MVSSSLWDCCLFLCVGIVRSCRMMDRAKKGVGASTARRAWFTLLLNGAHAAVADKHVPMYLSKGLLRRADTIEEVAVALGVDHGVLIATLTQYEADSTAGYVGNLVGALS